MNTLRWEIDNRIPCIAYIVYYIFGWKISDRILKLAWYLCVIKSSKSIHLAPNSFDMNSANTQVVQRDIICVFNLNELACAGFWCLYENIVL